MVKEITGGYKIQYHPEGTDSDTVWEVDFTPPFRRIDMLKDLEKAVGAKLPAADQLHTKGTEKKKIICFSVTAQVTFKPVASQIFSLFAIFTLKKHVYIANCLFNLAIIAAIFFIDLKITWIHLFY